MFSVESYAAVRRFVFVEGHSRREAARVFGLSRETVAKMCRFSLPPGYTRTKPAEKPKLGALLPVIDAILERDRTAPVKQRHTAKRIFQRLRADSADAGRPFRREAGRWRDLKADGVPGRSRTALVGLPGRGIHGRPERVPGQAGVAA